MANTPRVARLRDVAQLAAVDPSTASRVLRGDPAQGVRPETRMRIQEAASRLNYRPNAVARSLRTRQTDTFGLMVPTLDNIGFADVVHGIQAAAADAGKLVMLVEARAARGDDGDVYAQLVLDGRLDGLLVGFAVADDPLVSALAQRRLPLVLVNRRIAGIHGSVVVDDRRASRLAVEHLIGLGHERIGHVGFVPPTDTSRRRYQGFQDALRGAQLRSERHWHAAGEPTEEGGRVAVETLLAQSRAEPPTALFCASLLAAIGALGALRDAGAAVPGDMSVIAFNDHTLAGHTAPPLTTVRLPNFEMGSQAMRMLIRAAEGRPVGDLVVEDPPPEIVVRASTAPPRKRSMRRAR
jgi:LacI family transcriptional regulator